MMMPPLPQALSVFSCYAHEDATLREQFEKHLAMLKRLEWVATWSDRDINAGTEWQQALDYHLQTADLLLLFISADFLHSDYCYRVEMQEALRRHQAGEARVIPILLRPVEWKKTPLGALQALPRGARPVTSWVNEDEAFEQIAQEIRAVVEQLRQPVVIVASMPDRPFREQLARDLTTHGISLGEVEANQESSAQKEQIRGAAAVVVIASPETEHARVLKETESLLEKYPRPVMRVWITHNEGKDTSQPPSQHDWIVVDPGQEQHAVQELRTTLQRIRFHDPGPSLPSPQEAPVILHEPRNPYKGLRAFASADVGDFFGRTTLVDELLRKVQTTLAQEKKGQQPARLLALVGASGSGKSSVVQAGLLPALQAGKATLSEQWIYLHVITPKTHPLDELALALLDLFPAKSLTMLRDDLKEDSARGLHLYASALAKRTGAEHVVLVVDQFEEIFTLTEHEQERQQFLDLLVTACTKRDGPLIAIVTLRRDFYGHLMQHRALFHLVAKHLTPMLPMTLPDLRAVITQPAKLPDVQLTFEGNLVGDLLFEVQGQIGALPLLQFTLEQLVEQREGHLLTEYAYQEMGGIRGALAKHAEERYGMLPSDEHRELARTLFLRILDPGMTEQETIRRRATLTEFDFADGRQTRLMQETIDTFVKARLLTIIANERSGTTTVEVSHETLIREWPRLIDWLRKARDDISLQQNISRAAAAWERNARSGDRLYQGNELKEAQAWAKRNPVSRQEQAFLKASMVRYLRSLVIVVGVILFVVTSSGIAVWYAFFQPQPTLVTTQQDDEIGSLRWCMNNAPSGSTIRFAQNVKLIKLTGDLVIGRGKQLTIVGPGANLLTISGGNLHVHIHVFKGATLHIFDLSFKDSETVVDSFLDNEGSLTITNSVISNNKTIGDDFSVGFFISPSLGGGITNSGTLTVTNSTISGNHAITGWGGGIFNTGMLTLINSKILDNTDDDRTDDIRGGGGICNIGVLTLINSTVSDNKSLRSADGGIANAIKSTVTLINSTVSNNMADGDNGGIGNSGTLTLSNSTVSGNMADGDNGGIGNANALTLSNSTVSNNMAGGNGGGIGNYPRNDPRIDPGNSTLTVTNSTISGNHAAVSGGGIFNQSSTQAPSFIAQADLTFSTIYGNRASVGSDIAVQDDVSTTQLSKVKISNSIVVGDPLRPGPDISGALISFGYNLFQNSSGATFDSAIKELDDTDKILSVNDLGTLFTAPVGLQKNGGPTMTYMLGSSSPAIDAIPLQYCQVQGILNKQSRMYTDQRGMKRPDGSEQFCDIGAYEYQVSP